MGNWRKSSYSDGTGGDCVEVATWRKSTHSDGNGGDCVEVATDARAVLVRDTTKRDGGTLLFAADAWQSFTNALK
jgi:hypothetical protein